MKIQLKEWIFEDAVEIQAESQCRKFLRNVVTGHKMKIQLKKWIFEDVVEIQAESQCWTASW